MMEADRQQTGKGKLFAAALAAVMAVAFLAAPSWAGKRERYRDHRPGIHAKADKRAYVRQRDRQRFRHKGWHNHRNRHSWGRPHRRPYRRHRPHYRRYRHPRIVIGIPLPPPPVGFIFQDH